MANFTQDTTSGPTPPFSYAAYINAVQSFAAHRAGAGDSSTQSAGRTDIHISTGGNVSRLGRSMTGFNMTIPTYFPTKYPVISQAALWMYCTSKTQVNASSIWGTANKRGVGICIQDEGWSGFNFSNLNYQAVELQGHTEIATRVPDSSILASNWVQFVFTAAGVAYLNDTWSKSQDTDYVFFGACMGGDIDNTAPGGIFGDEIEYTWAGTVDGAHFPQLNITYEPQVQINIGDAWKTVESVQINVGDVWKDVDNLNINVGDDWKDRE